MIKWLGIIAIVLALLGFLDASYLTYEHYANLIPPCTLNSFFADCGKVLRSEYAILFGIPLAVIGLIHYSLLFVLLFLATIRNNRLARFGAIVQSTVGLVASVYFLYLQLFVIKAICLYCIVSAVISVVLFFIVQRIFSKERKLLWIYFFGWLYENFMKPIFFRIDPELVHKRMVRFGEEIGSVPLFKSITKYTISNEHPLLKQNIAGMAFPSPIGLAAGFDYEARLTQSLHPWGFGFQTVGTITNKPYGGNSRPMLGRLPQSKSLMVNKGFKNLGAKQTIMKLSGLSFDIPVGVSIGRTNTKELVTQVQSIADILHTFIQFEQSKSKHSYYELNISCPNLYGDISFYPPKNLTELLRQVDMLRIKRPIFIKMPIEKSDKEVEVMLKVIANHSPKGVIFGNLQKDRNNPAFNRTELKKYPVGNFSGKPTFQRSNELIKLAFKNYNKRFVIIGCGGVFSAKDAYEKVTLGASLIQLITGMIFEGPQLISQINFEFEDLLRKEGFTNISQAIGINK